MRWIYFMECSSLVYRSSVTDLYLLPTFKPLKKLFLGTSKLFKYCKLQYISSRTLHTNSYGQNAIPVYLYPWKNQFSDVVTTWYFNVNITTSCLVWWWIFLRTKFIPTERYIRSDRFENDILSSEISAFTIFLPVLLCICRRIDTFLRRHGATSKNTLKVFRSTLWVNALKYISYTIWWLI